MLTFEQLYQQLLAAGVSGRIEKEIAALRPADFDPYHLDCLLNPQKHALVHKVAPCDCDPNKAHHCAHTCPFEAMHVADGQVEVEQHKCVGCGHCIRECDAQKLKSSRDILPVLEALNDKTRPAYVLIAPAFLGQFSPQVTPGKLRSALQQIGFDGMIEVALFADILTLKEALEFEHNIQHESDYQLTSCCCPMWIALIRKVYGQLMPHVPMAVSPMIACGRTIKQLHPHALTVFVGPCIAKKSEAREADVAGAVDFVLTFQEMQDVFACANIDPAQMPDNTRDHSCRTGRIYAYTGGVSEAVSATLEKISPQAKIKIRTKQANGIRECKTMLAQLMEGQSDANFYEGMGCVGGCVGGPKALIPAQQGKEYVEKYGAKATYQTPVENPYVVELLERLGLPTVESLLQNSDIFTRQFQTPPPKKP